MKISLNHIKSWLASDISVPVNQIVDKLTSAGLEVESYGSELGSLKDVVVGEVISFQKHPNADNLNICQVSDGSDQIYQVICGANNLRVGMKTAFAKIGAILLNDFSIVAKKIRGIESQGMLCSKRELGLGNEHDGIIDLEHSYQIGKELLTCLDIDYIFDINITPNRGDCLSAIGIARELACYYDMNLIDLSKKNQEFQEQIDIQKVIHLVQPQQCPIYYGIALTNVNVKVATPEWIKQKLIMAGINIKNIIVDIINYIMIDMGQPMHAFDLDRLTGDIYIRYAIPDEQLILLNGTQVTMNNNTLVIADEKKAIAMAGVMGSLDSAVSDTTQNIFLESAYFNPDIIRGKSVEYQLTSDAAYRYERGIDPTMANIAINYAVKLIQQYAGGETGLLNKAIDNNYLIDLKRIDLSYKQIVRKLGFVISPKECERILSQLGFKIIQIDDLQISVEVPHYRTDIDSDYDLIEELLRIIGFDKIPDSDICYTYLMQRKKSLDYENIHYVRKIEDYWVNRDYQQTISYSFIDEELSKLFNFNKHNIKLLNPISDQMNYMRESIIPSIVSTASYNIHRQKNYFKIFELGNIFEGIEQNKQQLELGGLIYYCDYENWQNKNQSNFYIIKNDIEKFLIRVFKIQPNLLEQKIEVHKYLHPKNNLHYYYDNQLIVQLGEINPIILKELKIKKGNLCIFNVLLKNIREIPNRFPIKPISKFPMVIRDISFSIDKYQSFQQIIQVIQKTNFVSNIKNIKLVDCYSDDLLKQQQKISYSIRLSWQSNERALQDNEVNLWTKEIIKVLVQEFDIVLR